MLTIDGAKTLTLDTMGFFDSDRPWVHPTVTNPTYQILYVISGTVNIAEGETEYSLVPGQMLLLNAGTEHRGTVSSSGHVSFFWLHFFTDRVEDWEIQKIQTLPPDAESKFREIMHYSMLEKSTAELLFAKFLFDCKTVSACKNRIAYDLREYVRIHASENLKVDRLAYLYGFSPDYLSRVWKEEFGESMKEGIDRLRVALVENMLLNTTDSLSAIAQNAGFADANALTKFFTYHKKISPRTYRKKYYLIHMNAK